MTTDPDRHTWDRWGSEQWKPFPDPLAPARGVLLGVLIGLALLAAAVAVVAWWVVM